MAFCSFISLYQSLGYIDVDMATAPVAVALVALTATVVEALPANSFIDDNISVPVVTAVMSMMLMSSMV